MTAKAFAGVSFSDHAIAPFDTETIVQGRARGAKGALELWYNISTFGYVALDLGLAQAHRAYSARLRLGMRGSHGWSAGPELQRLGHIEDDVMRIGAFVRYETDRHEVSASAGIHEPDDSRGGGYLTGQWLMRF